MNLLWTWLWWHRNNLPFSKIKSSFGSSLETDVKTTLPSEISFVSITNQRSKVRYYLFSNCRWTFTFCLFSRSNTLSLLVCFVTGRKTGDKWTSKKSAPFVFSIWLFDTDAFELSVTFFLTSCALHSLCKSFTKPSNSHSPWTSSNSSTFFDWKKFLRRRFRFHFRHKSIISQITTPFLHHLE